MFVIRIVNGRLINTFGQLYYTCEKLLLFSHSAFSEKFDSILSFGDGLAERARANTFEDVLVCT